jgi:hypothetical protein
LTWVTGTEIEMAQVMVSAQFSYSISSEDLYSWNETTTEVASAAPYSAEWQRENNCGPDYDPDYFDKLEAYFEDEFGPLGEFVPLAA